MRSDGCEKGVAQRVRTFVYLTDARSAPATGCQCWIHNGHRGLRYACPAFPKDTEKVLST